jgi:hypothetical protein
VKQAVARKDETIKSLREQFQAASLRAEHLEQVGQSVHGLVCGLIVVQLLESQAQLLK